MYLAGVSVRRVEDIPEALWGTRASAGLISTLNKQVYEKIETWRNRKIEGRHAYVYAPGRMKSGMSRSLLLLGSMKTVSEKSLEPPKAPRKIKPAGAALSRALRNAGSRV
jgi:hypothetical protein